MKRKIIICIVIIVIIFITIFIVINKNNKKTSNKPVKYTVVEKLYEDNMNNKCTEVINITKAQNVEDIDDKVLLYLIFGQLKKDKKLSSNISIDDYKTSALKIIDEEYIPEKFEYVYEGYKYTLKDNITREKTTCDKSYVTKIYGYSGSDNLTINIMAGYVKDNKVYDLNNQEIGTYTEDDINAVLDNGTMQVYNYKKINDNYKLTSVGVK